MGSSADKESGGFVDIARPVSFRGLFDRRGKIEFRCGNGARRDCDAAVSGDQIQLSSASLVAFAALVLPVLLSVSDRGKSVRAVRQAPDQEASLTVGKQLKSFAQA